MKADLDVETPVSPSAPEVTASTKPLNGVSASPSTEAPAVPVARSMDTAKVVKTAKEEIMKEISDELELPGQQSPA